MGRRPRDDLSLVSAVTSVKFAPELRWNLFGRSTRSGQRDERFHIRRAQLPARTFTQVVRNAGGDCVLGVPKVIGAATASGPLVAVRVNNTGNEVCVNSACHYVTPATYAIRSGQTFEIEFSVSWFVGANDANGTPLYTAPPCVGEVTDVSRVAFPVASGAIAIDLAAASQQAGASVPWHQVCSSPTSIFLEIKP